MAMGCCRRARSAESGDDKTNGAASGAKNGLVPRSQRKCRDVLCCLLFTVYWVGMTIVAILAVKTGKPLSLVYGKDYNGDVCGDSANLTDRKLTAYPRLDQDLLAATAAGVDVANMQFFGVCVAACPLAGARVCTYDNTSCWTMAQDTTAMLFRCIPVASQNETILAEVCIDPDGADPTCTNARYLRRECLTVCHTKRVQKSVWEIEATTPSPLVEQLQGTLQVLGRFLNDMNAAKWLVLLVGGGGAMLLGVLWLLVLQFFAGCMVWLTCVLVLLALVLMSLFCSFRSGVVSVDDLSGLSFLASDNADNSTDSSSAFDTTALTAVTTDASTQLQFKVAAYVLWTLSAVVFVLLVAMRKRIHIAIAIIRESSKAIKALPLLLLWPVLPTLGFVVLVVYSVAIAAYLLSSDDLTSVVNDSAASLAQLTNSTSSAYVPQSASPKTTQQVLLAYHVFGFLWTNQLLQAISICAIAGSVAQFYWTAPDARGGRTLDARFPIARAVRNTLRYSLGSLCFGSFVIAFVQFLRLVLEYLDRNTKQLQQSNGVVKVAFLAVRCCLWCFEKCLKFLSKNAYIVIAMRGSSFCAASVEAFKILLTNVARVAVVNSISFFLLFLVKTTITLAVGAIVFAALSANASASPVAKPLAILSGPVTSPMAPVLASCVLAWLVASAFANVYDAAIDTILLCFCEDTAMNGETASEFMSAELRSIMGGSTSKHKVIRVGAGSAPSSPDTAAPSPSSSNKVHVDTDI